MSGINESPLIMPGSLRRVWRNAGAPSDGGSGTLATIAEKGDLLIDSTNATLYQNTNTQASPTWTQLASGGSGPSAGAVGEMAASGTSTANAAGVTAKYAMIDHVHALGTHDHSGTTKGGSLGSTSVTALTLAAATAPAGSVNYICSDNTGDVTVNALTGKSVNLAVNGVDVVTVAGALVTIAQAVSVTTGGLTVVAGGIDITDGGLLVSLGGITATGDSIITGALEVTGALTLGSTLTINATMTVDELILDTDGVAPAGTNAYVVSDNTGDLTLNALTGKEIHLAIAGTDVLDIGSGVEVISGGLTVTAGGLTVTTDGALITGNTTITGDLEVTGSLTFGGNWTVAATLTVDELILDTDGAAPGATNCYAIRDNSGDFTVNAVTGKQFIVAIAGTDEYTFSATVLDMNANALDNCGFVILNAATAPAASEVYLVNDNTGDLTLNALTGKSVLVAINGVDEYTFNAASFIVAAANTIRFAGDTGIVDSAGNEVIYVTAVGSAVNYLNVRNAATANPIILECLGTADKGFEFHNDQNEQILCLTPVASATVELTILNAATGGQPILRVTGEADLGIEIQNAAGEVMLETISTAAPLNWIAISNNDTGLRAIIKAMGEADMGIQIQNAAGEICFGTVSTSAPTVYLQVSPANTGTQPIIKVMGEADLGLEIQNADGEVECEFVSVAAALNWLSISNAATGAKPIILSAGEDDIGIEFQAKNAEPMLVLEAVAAAKDYIVITSAVTTAAPSITVAGDSADIDLSLAGKGSGYVRIDANMDMSDNTLYGSAAADGNLILSSTYNATKGFVGIANGEEGLRVGGTAVRGTVGTNCIHIYNGTAPVGALNNCVSIYADGDDAATEFYAMDAAGNATNLTP